MPANQPPPEGCTCVGEIIEGEGVHCDVEVEVPGYQHFQPEPEDTSVPPARPIRPRPFRSAVQFLAFGFGSGLSPKAPGTAGTVAAIPLFLLMTQLNLGLYSALVVLGAVVGVHLCDVASKELGVHDHPGIVWDEFVGFWVTMWAVPVTWQTVVAGFLVFRVFDIAKPWPIRALDKQVQGGFGIMVDDIVAGLFGCVVMHAGWYGLTGAWPLS